MDRNTSPDDHARQLIRRILDTNDLPADATAQSCGHWTQTVTTLLEERRAGGPAGAHTLFQALGKADEGLKRLVASDPAPEHTETTPESGDAPADDSHPNLTDLGNARRLIAGHGQDLRFCDPLGGWLVWTGRRWSADATGQLERMAKAVPRTLHAEAAAEPNKKRREAIGSYALATESAHRQRALLQLAWSEPGVPVLPEVFDTRPWLFNCLNGTVDLRTGELHPHRRADLLTSLAPVAYDPTAEDPTLLAYLADTTSGNDEFANYLQRAVGYSLTGLVDEEDVFLVLGKTATGKSTLVEALLAMLGDYGLKASFETFLLSRYRQGGPRPDLVRMRGTRLVAATEAPRGRRLAETELKELSGGDSITARMLYRDEVTFTPTFKIWLACNDAPQMHDDDAALWRRIKHLPFEHIIPEDQRRPELKRHLRDSPDARAALLAWAVRGCLAWQARGLEPCGLVRERTMQLRLEFDPLAEFFEALCVFTPTAQSAARELRSAYEGWAKELGARPINDRDWGKRLKNAGCVRRRTTHEGSKLTTWHGIGLLE